MRFAIFDLDNTVAQSKWRDVLKPPNGSWDEYHAACIDDKPNLEVIDMIKMLHTIGYAPIGMTRRSEKHREITNRWMIKHDVSLTHFFMAADRESRSIVDVKLAMIEDHFYESQRRDIAFYIDDDDATCAAMTEKYGIISLTCRFRQRN